tara:strand:- start:1223 stop:2086 length:864 start_codon:yes stop_codon:yes gene_type:complete
MISRIISTERIIPNLIVNLFGLQSARYIFAHLIYNLKFIIKKKSENSFFVKKNGYYKIENFLSLENLNGLKKEYDDLINSQYCKNLQNDGTQYLTVYLNDVNILKNYPLIKKTINDERIKKLFSESENKKDININCRLERIIVKDNNIEDTNKNFHYDTFHNTFKAWLYLSDSNDKNGPLVIVPSSHRFSIKRILNSYVESIKYCLFFKKIKEYKTQNVLNNYAKDNYQFFRYKNKKKLLDKLADKIISKKNTFLFANTHCIHRRGDAEENNIRDSIHFYSRENPFN